VDPETSSWSSDADQAEGNALRNVEGRSWTDKGKPTGLTGEREREGRFLERSQL